MKALPFLFIITLPLLSPADVTIELSGNGNQMRISISGTKKRVDSVNQLLNASTVSVCDVLAATETKWDTRARLYEESVFGEASASSENEESEPLNPKLSFKRGYNARRIAGFSADAFTLEVSKTEKWTLWMVSASADVGNASKELIDYQTALEKKMTALNLPVKKLNGEAIEILQLLSPQSARKLEGLPLPNGFPVCLEKVAPNGRVLETLYQVEKLDILPLEPNHFALPSGYKKTKSLMEEQIRDMK